MAGFLSVAGWSSQWPSGFESAWNNALKALGDRSRVEQQCVVSGRFRVVFAGKIGGIFDDWRFLCAYEGLPRMNGKPLQAGFNIDTKSLREIYGEFSLFFSDRRSGRIVLARDRFGTHPLYYMVMPKGLVASSECKCLIPFIKAPDLYPPAVLEAIRFRWVVGENHIVWPIKQVMSAGAVQFENKGDDFSCHRYWRIPFQPEDHTTKSLNEYSDELHAAFNDFFKNRQLNGKKVGILLSGGVDSSVVAAVAQQECPKAVAYTGYIPGDSNEEARRAELVAKRLSLPCKVVDINPAKFEEDLRLIVRRIEALPRNPNNLVLMQLYNKMAEDGIEVVLTGDGAEMLFGLADTQRISRFDKKRKFVRKFGSYALLKFFRTFIERLDNHLARRLARVLRQDTFEYALTLDEISYCTAVKKILIEETADWSLDCQFPMKKSFNQYSDFEQGLQAYQAYTTLQSSLVRHDRIAQPLGLESISPFLSEELVTIACRLPKAMKYTNRSRPVLKNLCDRIVHPDVSKWPKLGFPVPWRSWIDGPLSVYIGEACDYRILQSFLPTGFVEQAFKCFDYEALWSIMTLRILCEELGFDKEPVTVEASN